VKTEPTPRQAQYLAFIAQYYDLVQTSPSEGDIAHFFEVSGPSAHQMVLTLEARSFLRRVPGVPRSIRLSIPLTALPAIGAPGNAGSSRAEALATFGVYVAKRLAAGNLNPIAKWGSLLRMSARLERQLRRIRAPAPTIERAIKRIDTMAHRLLRPPNPRSPSPPQVAPQPRPPSTKTPKVATPDPRQRTLF
jgi:repressor LexA